MLSASPILMQNNEYPRRVILGNSQPALPL